MAFQEDYNERLRPGTSQFVNTVAIGMTEAYALMR
jgi:hypothetical protein